MASSYFDTKRDSMLDSDGSTCSDGAADEYRKPECVGASGSASIGSMDRGAPSSSMSRPSANAAATVANIMYEEHFHDQESKDFNERIQYTQTQGRPSQVLVSSSHSEAAKWVEEQLQGLDSGSAVDACT